MAKTFVRTDHGVVNADHIVSIKGEADIRRIRIFDTGGRDSLIEVREEALPESEKAPSRYNERPSTASITKDIAQALAVKLIELSTAPDRSGLEKGEAPERWKGGVVAWNSKTRTWDAHPTSVPVSGPEGLKKAMGGLEQAFGE